MDYYEREKRMRAAIEVLVPEFAEKEDDKIIQFFAELATYACGGPGQEYYEEFRLNYDKVMTWLEKKKEQKFLDISAASEWLREHVCSYMNSEYNEFHKCVEYDGSIDKERLINDFEEAMRKEQKPIKMGVYEIGKGTTVCGQDYKCKKDYKTGTCWYIKDAIYHCSRDGYLNDQNGVSWSCTPEWFKEYIQSHTEWAEEEKTRFVSGQFLQCKLSFDGFKEGEHYWLEYIGDDMYVGRSDNILNQKFHITPRQLYTLFSQQLDEVQGPPQEEKQVSLNYEPPFNENPSDKEIIEALIKHLKEQDGFLTAIDCVSTKSILSWLEKQKEQKPEHFELKAGKWYFCHHAFCCRADLLTVQEGERFMCEKDGVVKGFVIKEPEKYFIECSAPAPMEDEQKEQKPAEWDKLQEDFRNINEAFENGKKEVVDNPEKYGLYRPAEEKPSIFPPRLGEVRWNPISSVQQKPIFRVGDTIMAKDGTGIPQEMFYIERIEDGFYWEKDNTILISNQDEFQLVEPADNVSKDEYVKKFKALCDAYEIKLPNRTYDIYHLCDDLAELFGNTNKQE